MKDPAVLLYIEKWLVSTKGMRGNAKGWYLNLILYQYDRGELPNNIEELANLCDVRFSEFEEFKQVFEQELKHKFIVNDNGCLQNEFANELLKKRETFKEKRSDSGKLGYVIKYFRNNFKYDDGFENYFKENVNIDFDTKDEHLLKQVFKQNYKLYKNINKDINKDSITIEEIKENNNKEEIKKEEKKKFSFDFSNFDENFIEHVKSWLEYKKERKEPYKSQKGLNAFYNKLIDYSKNDPDTAKKIIEQSMANNWAGIFELKESQQKNKDPFYREPIVDRTHGFSIQF